VLTLSGALLFGCVSVDDVQTPNGTFGDDADGAGGSSAAPLDSEGDGQCGQGGWSFLRVAGREQGTDWAQPSLASGCASAPHRLSALAPRLGATLEILIAANGGRVIDATYSTTGRGADGEEWGEYAAFVELASLSFPAATAATEQPFDLAGTIWGPFGPVTLAAGGCARLRVTPC
jgi:hypothetical protein